MISLHIQGVVVRNTIGPQYRKAHVLCKQGLWSGYIPSVQTTQLDILTYATFLWTGNSINHTGTWSEIINPLHLNFFTMVSSHTASILSNTSSFQHNTTSSSQHPIDTTTVSQSSINTLCYFTTLYISQLAMSIPEKYPQNNIWTSLLRSIIHLQQQQWLQAWLTFEMSIFDESFNSFHLNISPHISRSNQHTSYSKTYSTLISQNYHKIAPYANKTALYYRHKLSQAYKSMLK